ncbi:MAG TPA: hypothetical protein VHE78_02845 [Gemmatimonadaceae bacterium]|nr:hypothetical protein [Gemmatimonadaceae bacterium]
MLITGDVVSYPIPYVIQPIAHAKALRSLLALDAATIIPGHGPAFHDTQFLSLELRLFDAVRDAVLKARSDGIANVSELQSRITVEELRQEFTHNDANLDARVRLRVRAMVGFVLAELAAR